MWSAVAAAVGSVPWARSRWRLSRAKHPSLAGHSRLAQRLARLVPPVSYGPDRFFDADGVGTEVAARRRDGLMRLAERLRSRSPVTLSAADGTREAISDMQFTARYRVPFQFSRHVAEHLPVTAFVASSSGVRLRDLDGNEAYDVAGSYGVNLFGYDFYKSCMAAGAAEVNELGPVLGLYHPVVRDVVARLCEVSGLDEVSFHMSGTEAVMQAVRLARYHTGRSHVVRFCGAYHGWWDEVQPGVGNPRPPGEVYTLRDVDERSLEVVRTRRDIACVLVNPLQALHPNAAAPSDSTLVASGRQAGVDRERYAAWLRGVRRVCLERDIAFIIDDVFTGFRLARGGAQEYFGVAADMVTYGKTLGGGFPVGAVCGTRRWMRRFSDDRPSDVCFARGTFNTHPYVMAAMREFLVRLAGPELLATYDGLDARWTARVTALNARLAAEGVPVRAAGLVSIWTLCYTTPSRYNWMLQYYLRAEGLALSWVGTGRLIFSHNYSDADMAEVIERIASAARRMAADGWWEAPAGQTNTSIAREVARELLATRLARRA